MKILIIHNEYKNRGGEEGAVELQISAFTEAGHEVITYIRKYAEIKQWRCGKVASFFTALYNRGAIKDIRRIIENEKPQIAIVNNLFPVISPAILKTLSDGGVRVMMVVHNYRLMCPTGLMYRSEEVCHACIRSCTKEWSCTRYRCEGSLLGSIAYSVRSLWARQKGYYRKYVDRYIVLTSFQRALLQKHYLNDASKYVLAPNPFDSNAFGSVAVKERSYIGFVGRLSEEKGMDIFFDIARQLPELQFRVAGEKACPLNNVPANVKILGFLNKIELSEFYSQALAILVTSKCYEGFPLVLTEAAYHNTPSVVPRNGNFDSIVAHYPFGELYEWKNSQDAVKVIRRMCNDYQQHEISHIATNMLSTERYVETLVNSVVNNRRTIKYSIITVCYNAAEVIEPTLKSIAAQTYTNIEYIIIDGASIDDTLRICNTYSEHITQIVTEKDSGIYDAMNKGLERATGDYVLYMNAGDEFYAPDVLKQISQQLALEHELPTVIYGDTAIIDHNRCYKMMRQHRPPRQLNWKSFRMGMLVCHQSFFARRDIAPRYNLSYRFSSDFDWTIRCLKAKGRVLNSQLIVASYLEEGMTTRNHKKSLMERFAVMKSHYGIVVTCFTHLYIVFRYIIKR